MKNKTTVERIHLKDIENYEMLKNEFFTPKDEVILNGNYTDDYLKKFASENNYKVDFIGRNNNMEGQEFMILSKLGSCDTISAMLIDTEQYLFKVIFKNH
jgi:hypothetical protein